MNTNAQPPEQDDDMPAEIDFSNATRGKFYHPNAKLKLPVYLGEAVIGVGVSKTTEIAVSPA